MQTLNDHLELEVNKHPDRSYLTTLTNSQPQFSASNLFAEAESEAEFWMACLTADGKTFLEAFRGNQHAFDALKHEHGALKDIERAIALHGKGAWAEASIRYGKAISDLHFALSDWNFAIHEYADDSPFDPYYPGKEERVKYDIEEPPRTSYEDMRQIAPFLFRIYRNLDRLFVIGQEITQRQIACLMAHTQVLEEQQAEQVPTQASEEPL